MKRSTKQLLSMLLAIVMVIGLAVPAMAARPMGGDAVETPAGEAAPQVGHSGSKASTAKLLETTGQATTYKLDFEDEELSGVASNGTYAAGKYGTGDFFTFSDSSIARKDVSSVPGLNIAKNGANYIGFEITGTDATVKVTFRGASGSGKVSGGAVYKYDGDTQGDALVDANNPTDNIESNAVTVTATYTNVAQGSYRVVETANQTTVHVLSIEVTETDGNVYTDCDHSRAAADPSTAKDATCTAPGKKADTVCPDCGKVIEVGEAIPAAGHQYENGQCTVCHEKQPTKLVGGSWKANLDSVPGVAGTATDQTFGPNLAADTRVKTEGVTAVELWAPGNNNKYKYQTESGAEGFDGWLGGNDNPVMTATDTTADVTSGSYFIFKAKTDGILTIYTKVNGAANNAKPYYCVDKEGNFLTPNSGKGFETAQTPLKDTVQVKAGDEVRVWFKGGKIMLYGFDFTVSINESWKANLDSVPGVAGTATDQTFGPNLAADTQVKTEGVTAVELWAPGNNNKYKYQTESGAEGFDGWLGGNDNPVMTATDTTADVTSGSYFIFKVKADGVLTIYTKVNGAANNAKPYYCVDKEGNFLTPNSGKGFETAQTPLKDTVQVKEGDEVRVWFKGGKIMLYGFDFKSGSLEEVTAEWTAAAQGAEGATITGTPDNTKGTITVTVTGPKVGVITDEVAGTMTTYADSLTVQMLNAAGDVVATKSDVTASDTHSATFKPSASGDYSFQAFLNRTGETDIAAGTCQVTGFILPLANPSISSAASNGAGADGKVSMTLMWGAVTEADTYKVFVKETSAAAWPTDPATTVTAVDGKATYSYVVPGLTAETSYDFKVSVTRTATNETKESDPFTSMADAEKVTAWVEKTFGTSSTDQNNKVVRSDNSFTFTGLGKEVVKAENGTYTLTVPENDKQMTATNRKIENLTGDLNTDDRVLLSSWNGAGKIKEGEGADGLLFYYTAIPAGTNYTLTADAEVLRWATRDTQNGFGLAAMDRVPDKSWTGSSSDNAGNYWNNVYYAGAARGSFSYDTKTNKTYSDADLGYDSATKYSYYMGPYAVTKTGIPLVNGVAYDSSAAPANYYERRFPLDTRLAIHGRSAKYQGNTNRFNLIGNYVVAPKGFSSYDPSNPNWNIKDYELTKVKIKLQKNNTGYIATMYDETGTNMLGQNIEYFVTGAMDLSGDKPYHDDDVSGRKDIPALKQCLDSDYEYVGMFTSRDIDVLFSNVKLTTVDPAEDDPAVEPPTNYVIPTMSITSGDSSNSADFTLSVTASVEGTVSVKQKGVLLPETYEIKYNEDGETERKDIPVTLTTGSNSFEVTFTPDPDQDLPPYTGLDNTNPITKTSVVTYNPNYKYLQNIYVSPDGISNGYGTKSEPLDIYTAVKVVSPGQNIVLMEGVYNLQKGISIGRGMSGSAGTVTLPIAELDENGDPVVDEETGAIVTKDYVKDARIYMLADVDENGDPVKVVLNGQRKYSVLTQGASYWVFKDFEVVGSSGTGFQVAGNYNLVQNVKLHDNLSTGLQISRLSNGDRIPDRNGAEPSIDGDKLITDWGDWPCHNIILNCESYRNYDSGYGGADGFGAKETCGEGNIFDGCAAYWNSDDGWDLYAKTEPDKGPLGRVTIKNSVAFENGYEVRKLDASGAATYDAYGNAEMNYDADGKIVKVAAGNGNGFKMGGSHLPGAHSITNSFAFYNLAKGFDSNNGPDIKVHGSTAYNNAQENVGLSSKFSTLNYEVDTTVSFKDDKCPTNPNVEAGKSGPTMADETPTGGTSVYNYYQWDGKASKGVGTVSGNITAANFVSLDFDNTKWVNGAVRDETGALDLGDFLKLKDVTDAGATQDKVEPETPVVTPDNVIDPPQEGPSKDTSRRPSGGNGGTIADAIEDANKTDEDNKTETTFDANKTTDSAGNTEIVVKDETGETVADVKIPATIPDSDVVFEDAVGHWAEDAIEDMAALGIVNGIGDNTYGVDSDVTRGALATMLFRLANGKLGIGNTFGDVASGEWYTDAIGWAVKVGVVTGYPDDTFKPGDSITREQLATMLARFAKLVGLDVSADSSDLAGYKDVSDVDSWATDGMAWCVKNGVINGVSADSLSPDTSATRAQTATMLSRFIDLLK